MDGAARRGYDVGSMAFSGEVELLDNVELGGGHYLSIFDAPEIAATVRPGQFVMLRVRDGTDPLLGRPFSVARVGRGPRGATIDLLYRAMGRGTSLLGELRAGARVGLVGPLGRPFPDPIAADVPVFFVAGGIGVAPFPFLAEHLTRFGSKPRLLFGARTARDLVARDLIAAHGVDIEVATDDGSEGHRGFVPELLDRALAVMPEAERRRSLSYVCGPTPMMAATDAVLARHGAGGQFSVEAFMGCGFGVCLSCVVPVKGPGGEEEGYRRICVDGPTFPAGRIHWPRSPAV
jgi:dihydroorotate dehydrogenase electron transfer subunit